MKKLERMDGKLFEDLRKCEIPFLDNLLGGEIIKTCNVNNDNCSDTAQVTSVRIEIVKDGRIIKTEGIQADNPISENVDCEPIK
ncbi:MAG: hypothetical protein FGM41_07600 [Bacteroidetes bacterium]|nr:hypothetical protein [Bacteroidota bacterium]